LIWIASISAHFAMAGVTLPLEGYTRPGRFFPVKLDGPDADRPLEFSSDGCLPAALDPSTAVDRIVPILTTASPGELRWPGGSIALRSLAENERLIACSTDEADKSLFPNDRQIVIRLDPADLLPGPAVAWESLDALQLDSAQFQRLTDDQRSSLLAAGVTLAARGKIPDHRWPWRFNGSLWILSATATRPTGELIDDHVYAPTYGWSPGWSPQIRGQVMGVATLLILLTAGILLVRRNRTTAASAIILCLLTAAAVAGWRHSLGNIDRAGGDILIADHGLLQRDSWVYQRAKSASIETVPWTGNTHPIFASVTAMTQADMRLHITSNNELSFIYHAIPGHTLAFVRSEIQPGPIPATINAHQSPMQEAARAAYLSAGFKVIGETPGMPNRWPGVAISR
jgi:hypothetical protein